MRFLFLKGFQIVLGLRGVLTKIAGLSPSNWWETQRSTTKTFVFIFFADSSTHILHGKQLKTFSTFYLILLPKIFMNFFGFGFFSFTDSRVPGSGLLISLVLFI